jgi:GTPase Era involved in 16S rRNA processing
VPASKRVVVQVNKKKTTPPKKQAAKPKETKTAQTSNAFVIEQDVKHGVWTISMSEQLRTLLTQTAYYKDKSQLIYVTDQDDPNILLDTIEVKLYNILFSESFVLPDQLVKVAQNLNVSLYCGKIFENYYHLVKNYEN